MAAIPLLWRLIHRVDLAADTSLGETGQRTRRNCIRVMGHRFQASKRLAGAQTPTTPAYVCWHQGPNYVLLAPDARAQHRESSSCHRLAARERQLDVLPTRAARASAHAQWLGGVGPTLRF